MFGLISRFLLICHFSLMFSLLLLCFIFYLRTRDKIVKRLLLILIPLFLHGFASLFYYVFSADLNEIVGRFNSAMALFLLVLTSLTVPMILYGASNYMLSLLEIPTGRRRIGRKIITVYSVIFSLMGLYFIVYIHGDNWIAGLSRALNHMFVFGSFLTFFVAMTAMFFYRKIESGIKRRLIKGVIISFSPLIIFSTLDLFFFMTSPYKLVYLSFFVFSILVYFDTARQYIHKYNPQAPPDHGEYDRIFSSFDISGRERELIPMMLEGKSNREISEKLFISPNTVKSHVRSIYKKTGASNRLQLLSKFTSHPEG